MRLCARAVVRRMTTHETSMTVGQNAQGEVTVNDRPLSWYVANEVRVPDETPAAVKLQYEYLKHKGDVFEGLITVGRRVFRTTPHIASALTVGLVASDLVHGWWQRVHRETTAPHATAVFWHAAPAISLLCFENLRSPPSRVRVSLYPCRYDHRRGCITGTYRPADGFHLRLTRMDYRSDENVQSHHSVEHADDDATPAFELCEDPHKVGRGLGALETILKQWETLDWGSAPRRAGVMYIPKNNSQGFTVQLGSAASDARDIDLVVQRTQWG